jgi:hypothetical protein
MKGVNWETIRKKLNGKKGDLEPNICLKMKMKKKEMSRRRSLKAPCSQIGKQDKNKIVCSCTMKK